MIKTELCERKFAEGNSSQMRPSSQVKKRFLYIGGDFFVARPPTAKDKRKIIITQAGFFDKEFEVVQRTESL